MTALLPPRTLRLTQRKARAKVKRDAEKARPTPQQANERPRYPALARGVAAQYAKVTAAYADLRRDWLKVVERQPETEAKAVGSKNIGVEDMRDVDAAIERFMLTMAGPKPRDKATFAAQEEALVQDTNILAHRIGADRAAEQLNIEANPELTRLQKHWVNERAFDRLSEDGRLRFEEKLGDIKSRMLEAFDKGESPLKIAKELGEKLDGYHQGRLRTICRTEMGFAAVDAQRGIYAEQGVTKVEIIGDPGTDELCTNHIGSQYPVDDADNQPPYHPNCFCDLIPVTE